MLSPQLYWDLEYAEPLTRATDTGDGIRMGMAIGAATEFKGGIIGFDFVDGSLPASGMNAVAMYCSSYVQPDGTFVSDVIDYSASLAVFMDIDQCRDLFDEDDEYFNAVFSDHELDIETGRLYSVISKSDIEKSAGIYVDMMGPMITVMSVAAAVIFLVVMYLMLKMMLDRSSFNISLVKIFGFRNREVRQMYLDGNFYIVAVGALISIPLCKRIMDYLYPRYLVSNVAVGVSPTYSTAMYVVIFLVIIALYFVINFALMARIRKIEPAEVLKNRE